MPKQINKTMTKDSWDSFFQAVFPNGAPHDQYEAMRKAFYAGSTQMFYGILNILDEGEDATEKDLFQMDAIDAELKAFIVSVGLDAAAFGTKQ